MLISSGTDVGYARSIRFWQTANGATFVYGRTNGLVAVAHTPLVGDPECNNNGVCDCPAMRPVQATSGRIRPGSTPRRPCGCW